MEKEPVVKCFSLEEYKKVQKIGFKFGWLWGRWRYSKPQRKLAITTGWEVYQYKTTKKDPICIRFGIFGFMGYSPLSFYKKGWKIISAKTFINNPTKWLKKQGGK